MSDDLRIQQRPSAMPYVLGGGLVGAGLGYWGLDKIDATRKLVSDPGKFNSVQEIIDATNKKDEFVKLIEDAGAEHKGAMEKIKGLGEKVKEAENNWQTKLEAFFKEKGIKEKATETVEEVISEGTVKKTTLKDSLEYYGRKYNARANELEAATTPEAKEKAKQAIKELDAKFEELTKKVIDQCEFKGDEARVKTLKENLAKELRTHREALTQYYNRDHIIRSQEDMVSKFTKLQGESKTAKEALEKAYENLSTKLGVKNITPGSVDMQAKHKIDSVTKDKNFLENILKDFKQADGIHTVAISTNGKPITAAIAEGTGGQFAVIDGKKQFFNNLSTTQKKKLTKMFEGREITVEALENAIKESENTIEGIKKAKEAIAEKSNLVTTTRKKLKNLSDSIATWYDGAKVKDGKLIKPDGTRWKAPKGATGELPKIKWPSGANLKEDAVFEYMSGKKVKTTEVAKELSEEGKKALGEFIEKNGKKEDAAKNILDNVKDELKALTEGKVNNKKLLAGAAITAAVVAGIALMFRPKAKEQQTA